MLTVTGLWFDHERTPVGLDHTPVFGCSWKGTAGTSARRSTACKLP